MPWFYEMRHFSRSQGGFVLMIVYLKHPDHATLEASGLVPVTIEQKPRSPAGLALPLVGFASEVMLMVTGTGSWFTFRKLMLISKGKSPWSSAASKAPMLLGCHAIIGQRLADKFFPERCLICLHFRADICINTRVAAFPCPAYLDQGTAWTTSAKSTSRSEKRLLIRSGNRLPLRFPGHSGLTPRQVLCTAARSVFWRRSASRADLQLSFL